MSGYIDGTTIAALRQNANLAFFFRLGTTSPMRLVLGVNDIPIGIPVLDGGGSVYLGAGRLLNIPDLEMLINGITDKVTFSVSGVDAATVAAFAVVSPKVLGSLVTIGMAVLDTHYQPIGSIVSLWDGGADYWAMDQPVVADETAQIVRTISLVCASGDQSRGFPALDTFTAQSQKTKYPTDSFCDNVARYYAGQVVSWPRYT